jgi:hypothetical protein
MLLPRPSKRPNERRKLTFRLDEKPGDPHQPAVRPLVSTGARRYRTHVRAPTALKRPRKKVAGTSIDNSADAQLTPMDEHPSAEVTSGQGAQSMTPVDVIELDQRLKELEARVAKLESKPPEVPTEIPSMPRK